MWNHPSKSELMEVLEGTATPRARAHAEECPRCKALLEHAGEALGLAHGAQFPEPPPLYWEVFRRQVGGRLDRTVKPRSIGPLLAAAAVLVAVSVMPFRTKVQAPEATLPAWRPLPPAEEDSGLAVLQTLAPLSEELRPATDCPSVAECVAGLSDDETRLLAEDLRSELTKGKL
jgi:hypothetical protein